MKDEDASWERRCGYSNELLQRTCLQRQRKMTCWLQRGKERRILPSRVFPFLCSVFLLVEVSGGYFVSVVVFQVLFFEE